MPGHASSVPFRVVWDDAAQVVRGEWAPGAVCTEDLARASIEAVVALGVGRMPVLIDIRGLKRLERGAREYYKGHKADATALALLVDSPLTQMIANFFIHTTLGGKPTRMFTDDEAALAWLHSVTP